MTVLEANRKNFPVPTPREKKKARGQKEPVCGNFYALSEGKKKFPKKRKWYV